MARLRCPRCDATFSGGGGWAATAVAMLVPAPAVPDMATQVRCPNCGHVFAQGEVRHLGTARSAAVVVLVLVLALAGLAWLGS